MPTTRIIVIGGGISGLAAAHRLIELSREKHLDLEVIRLEAGRRLGGEPHGCLKSFVETVGKPMP